MNHTELEKHLDINLKTFLKKNPKLYRFICTEFEKKNPHLKMFIQPNVGKSYHPKGKRRVYGKECILYTTFFLFGMIPGIMYMNSVTKGDCFVINKK